MDIEELAMCVLDRLISTPHDRRREVTSRSGFVHHHVADEYQKAYRKLHPRAGAYSFTSQQAIEAFPDYAQALTEAWTFLESQGFLVPDPGIAGRVFIGKRGEERHAMYRGVRQRVTDARDRPVIATERPTRLPSAQPAVGPAETSSLDRHPTAAVLWAHSDPDWTGDEESAWRDAVLGFTHVLLDSGIDADIDLFHGHVATDWARFGPAAIRNADYVLIAVSRTWRRAWDGDLAADEYAGARGEANALRGLHKEDADRFLEKVIPVILPGASEDDIPTELRATSHWSRVRTLDETGIDDLYRRLTGQAGYPKPPLGKLRKLPPLSSPATITPPAGEAPERPSPPRLSPHPTWGTGSVSLRAADGPLSVHIINSGGSTAHVVSASLRTALGAFEGLMYVIDEPPLRPQSARSAALPAEAHLVIEFGDGDLKGLDKSTEPLRLRVRFRTAGRSELYEYRLNLHRAGAHPSGTPLWRGKSPETLVVDG